MALSGSDVAGHQHQRLEAGQRVARAVGVQRGERAVVARVHGLQHVQHLVAAHLADDDAVGPHAQRVAHQVALRDLRPCLRCWAGRVSSRTTCGCWSCSSAESSIVTMRSSAEMKRDRMLSRVVLPEPVPPEISMFRRARTAPREELQRSSASSEP